MPIAIANIVRASTDSISDKQLADQIKAFAQAHVPAGATVIVVSTSDHESSRIENMQ